MFIVRTVNIAVRTGHIAAMGILLGGHAFDVGAPRLLGCLCWTVGTGVALAAVEAGPQLVWFHQGRGLMMLGKLVLLCLVPWFWRERLVVLLAVVVIGSVGSHMPARFRYYSLLYRKVIPCGGGPGSSRLEDELGDDSQTGRSGCA